MAVNERDLITFAIISGLWLKTRAAGSVREALKISKECGGYTSSSLFLRSIQRLVRAGWVVARQVKTSKGIEVNRYVPTLRGFVEYATMLDNTMNDNLAVAFTSGDTSPLLQFYELLDNIKCIEKYTPVAKVWEIGRALATLLDVVVSSADLPREYEDLARAVEEARAADEIDFTLVERVADSLPALSCIIIGEKTYDVISELLVAAAVACKRGLVSHLQEALRTTLEAYIRQAQYCAHLGVQFDVRLAENILRNLTHIVRCSTT